MAQKEGDYSTEFYTLVLSLLTVESNPFFLEDKEENLKILF